MDTNTKFAEATQRVTEGAANVRKFAQDGLGKARTVIDQTTAQASQATGNMMKVGEDAAEFGRGNLEAIGMAAQATMTGMQEAATHSLSAMQALGEQTMATLKAVASAKSLKEAADLQAAFLRATFDRAVTEQGKLQELTLKTSEAAFAPFTARFRAAMDKAGRTAA